MINKVLIKSQIAQMRRSLKRIAKFSRVSLEEFSNNPDNFAIAEHHLRKSLEILFDIGRHIIAKEFSLKPEDYDDVIKILDKNKVISDGLYKRTVGFGRFRNRLVHLYWQVTEEEILEFIKRNGEVFEKFCKEIIEYTYRR